MEVGAVTNDAALPPAPPEAPVQQKKRLSGWKIAGMIFLGLLILGAIQDLTKTKEPTGTSSVVAPPTSCIDTEAAAARTTHASEMLTAAGEAANAGDAATVSSDVQQAAEDIHEVARLTAADPAISVPAEATANHLDTAVTYIDAGNYDAAIAELTAANASLEQSRSAIGTTDVPAC
jgi:hypothetical protein